MEMNFEELSKVAQNIQGDSTEGAAVVASEVTAENKADEAFKGKKTTKRKTLVELTEENEKLLEEVKRLKKEKNQLHAEISRLQGVQTDGLKLDDAQRAIPDEYLNMIEVSHARNGQVIYTIKYKPVLGRPKIGDPDAKPRVEIVPITNKEEKEENKIQMKKISFKIESEQYEKLKKILNKKDVKLIDFMNAQIERFNTEQYDIDESKVVSIGKIKNAVQCGFLITEEQKELFDEIVKNKGNKRFEALQFIFRKSLEELETEAFEKA